MRALASVQEISLRATVRRIDGTTEDLGTIAYWHRNPLRRAVHWLSRNRGIVLVMALWSVVALLGAAGACSGLVMATTVYSNTGKAITAALVCGGSAVPKYLGWGTGAGTSLVGDTTLFTESTEETRAVGTLLRTTTTLANDTVQVTGTLTVVTSAKSITNFGIFDALTSGNLYLKADFTTVPLAVGESISFTASVKYA